MMVQQHPSLVSHGEKHHILKQRPDLKKQPDQTIIAVVEAQVNRNDNDASSIITQYSLSSVSTNNTRNSAKSILTAAGSATNPSPHNVYHHHHHHRDSNDDDTAGASTTTTSTQLHQLMESMQIKKSPSDNCCNGSTTIATLSTNTTSPSEAGDAVTVDDTVYSSGSSSSKSVTSLCSGSQHHQSDDHNGNVLLHELILDYPINVLTYPHRRLEYEEQIRQVAQSNPEWVITYNQNGYTPFHIACETGGISCQIIQDLFYTYPSAITTPTQPPKMTHRSRHRRNSRRRHIYSSLANSSSATSMLSKTAIIMLPLHLTCRYYTGMEQYNIIAFLLQMYPDAVKIWTKTSNSNNIIHVVDEAASNPLRANNSNSNNTNVSMNNEDGSYGEELPIHLYCQNHFCNQRVLQQLLIPAYPEAIQTFSSRTGQLPIHMVCERQYFQRISNPKYDRKTTAGVSSKTSTSSSSDDIIKLLLTLYPKSVTIPDIQRGELPFCTAIRGYQSILSLQQILSYHSMAIIHVDMKGRTPLHRYCMMLASSNNQDSSDRQSDSTTPAVDDRLLSYLIQQDTNHIAGTMVDDLGCLPLHYVINRSNVSLDVVYKLIRSHPASLVHIVNCANTAAN